MKVKKTLRIFFSGIGGSGVSAIAGFMADKGDVVTGSDRAFDRDPANPVCRALKAKGISIVPQDGRGLDRSFDFAVFSTAVEADRPEVLRAKELGVSIKTRPEYLSEIVSAYETIAVAGTSGKSTTSGMLAFLMSRLGLAPNFIGGGRVKQFKTSTNLGNSVTGNSDLLVIEACESDGTIVNYRPWHSILLNLDLDHHSMDETSKMFRVLLGNTSGKVITNADDINLERAGLIKGTTFSIDGPSDFRAGDISFRPFETCFSLRNAEFRLSLPGRYNLYNALACIAMLNEMGVSPGDIAGILHEFRGIERRFDVHLDDGKRIVIDDYAHNPHKIAALICTLRDIRKSFCYIFQPHGFGPTRMMKKEYIEAFVNNMRDSDHLILLPIFYAGGTAAQDISSDDLAAGIRAVGKSVEVAADRRSILDSVDSWGNYVIFGARDETLSDFARNLAGRISMSSQH